MLIIKLKGISLHSKNRIREHGEDWRVIEDNPLTPSPDRLFIESVQTGDRRWLTDQFEIVSERS